MNQARQRESGAAAPKNSLPHCPLQKYCGFFARFENYYGYCYSNTELEQLLRTICIPEIKVSIYQDVADDLDLYSSRSSLVVLMYFLVLQQHIFQTKGTITCHIKYFHSFIGVQFHFFSSREMARSAAILEERIVQ